MGQKPLPCPSRMCDNAAERLDRVCHQFENELDLSIGLLNEPDLAGLNEACCSGCGKPCPKTRGETCPKTRGETRPDSMAESLDLRKSRRCCAFCRSTLMTCSCCAAYGIPLSSDLTPADPKSGGSIDEAPWMCRVRRWGSIHEAEAYTTSNIQH